MVEPSKIRASEFPETDVLTFYERTALTLTVTKVDKRT